MNREILLDSMCGRTRLALYEDGQLCEYYFETSDSASLSGNIYVGRVQKVLPGMNAAFVDIGLDKNAFLYAGDIRPELKDAEEFKRTASITELVKSGQEILVQVDKEPGGTKGPRVTNQITLTGRNIVLLPDIRYIGVSRKIQDDSRRGELRSLGEALLSGHGRGMIMRTAAETASDDDITAEYVELVSEWGDIEKRGKVSRAPVVIKKGGMLVERALRDMSGPAGADIVTDSHDIYAELLSLAGHISPNLKARIRLHNGDIPLFDLRGVEKDIEKAYANRVWLKSGGFIVIDRTEALTVIDVNTGKYTGKNALEDTIFTINTEAAQEIARQLRLRDLGGIIIVDFIDMEKTENRDALIEKLKAALSTDRTRVQVAGMTNLGLVEITRKKSRQSLSGTTRRPCPICGGSGEVDTMEQVAWRAVGELRRRHMLDPDSGFIVRMPEQNIGAITAIGVPKGIKAHVELSELVPVGRYEIEAVPVTELSHDIKLLREK